ncbi:protoheme IX farnesyltransferase [Methanonatronarchaeum sp. AMET-Sl]|uniref:protoheme IX farnesyltransferase n=1 Tax=Methanonatronarchaeum sp. AMET-Sl TaxID=3037654 RepID=UPI00244E1308|nr:protoheme IX farnesyltransferase [Methanonatronarchaeum sp. AMET-Sl]WGI17692.1 protoheme IX farnesyltransferase [Methanonatronarchaeum sp. AMET-Sl]
MSNVEKTRNFEWLVCRTWRYIELVKPKETFLLIFAALATGVIAAQGTPPLDTFIWVTIAVTMGVSGTITLTNYLDRDIDRQMQRTQDRPIPSNKVKPKNALYFATTLVLVSLAIGLYLHPLAFFFGATGVLTSIILRKKSISHILGGYSSVAPLLFAWVALAELNLKILLISILVFVWVPVHVWSVMVAYKHDYREAGVTMFPVNQDGDLPFKLFILFSILLFITSIILYLESTFGTLYLTTATILGLAMIIGSTNLYLNREEKNAWLLYKVSSFPYLGIIFLTMMLEYWI